MEACTIFSINDLTAACCHRVVGSKMSIKNLRFRIVDKMSLRTAWKYLRNCLINTHGPVTITVTQSDKKTCWKKVLLKRIITIFLFTPNEMSLNCCNSCAVIALVSDQCSNYSPFMWALGALFIGCGSRTVVLHQIRVPTLLRSHLLLPCFWIRRSSKFH